MMRWDSFGRSAAFAAVAALGWAPWVLVAAPLMGWSGARTVYLIAAVSVYVGGMGGPGARRLPAALLTALAGGAIAVLGRDPAILCLGLAVALAVARSVFLHHAAPARAVMTEAMLAGGGLVFARLLGTGSPLGAMLPIWGFFLVQSCFFLVGGARERADDRHPDPFEAAHARALEVLERAGG